MAAFAFNDEPIQIIDLYSGEQLPSKFVSALHDPTIRKKAHNAVFERQCFAQVGQVTEIEQWECTAIKSAYCGLPLSLDQVSKALALGGLGKSSEGKALIKYFCMPCKPTKVNGQRSRNLPKHDLDKWEAFKNYCIQDVVAERSIAKILAKYKIPEFERQNYILDQKINDRGVLLDLELADTATNISKTYSAQLMARAKELTGLDNPNSPAQLCQWLTEATQQEVKTIAKAKIVELLESTNDGIVTEVLQLRQKLSKSSVKKYLAMPLCACDDNRARGLFQFYGASRTGRWAGRLIQLQNLPQNHLKPLDLAREVALRGDWEQLYLIFGDVNRPLSELIRTALIAPAGHTFAVADFSSIEARVIAWLANEKWRLDVFNTHGKIYEASASMMFNKPIEECSKEAGNGLRAKGKVAELALGYQGSVGALKTMGGEKMGLSEAEMKIIVDKWRKASPNIKQLWYTVDRAAKEALRRRGKTIEAQNGKLKFFYDGKTLRIRLPSGRCLFYFAPKFGVNKFGSEAIKYRGVDSITKRWSYLDTYGGKLVENIVQAIARDLLIFSMQNLDEAGFRIVMHVHDEAAAEVPLLGQEEALDQMCSIMSLQPTWAEGLPLNADGYLTPYYKKD